MKSNAKTIFLLGAAGLIIGSLMPWAQVTTGLTGTLSISGMQGDGIITLIGGVLFLLLGLTKKPQPGKFFSVIAGIIGIGLIFLMISKIVSMSGIAAANEYGFTSLGAGLWITAIGAVISTVGGFSKNPVPEVPPSASQ